MENYFFNFWNWVERSTVLETDSPDGKRQKVTLVILAAFSCLTGVLSITQSLLTSRPVIEVLMPLAFTTVVGTALISYFMTKRFAILVYSFLTMVLFIPVFFQISIGGFSGQGYVPIILWSILAPFGSLMFQNVRMATWWFAAYLILFIALLVFDEYFTQFADIPISFAEANTSHTAFMMSQFTMLGLLSIIVFVSMRYFVNAFQKEHGRAEKLVVDLTQTNNELESALRQLQETQAELVQSEMMASLGKLAAGIAHEINNPIGALKSTANTSTSCISKLEQFFENKEDLSAMKTDEKLQHFLKILKNTNQVFTSVSERIANSVNSFINFARLDKAGFDKVDIHESLDNTLTLIQNKIKSQTGVVKDYSDIQMLGCYPAELNQVFLNLLTNAAQAIQQEGEITIRTFEEKGFVHVQISDTGIGIPENQLPKIFEPDFTKNGSRVKAGFGLFTAYNIVKKHEGQLNVESIVGKGSTFTIILPTDLEN